MANMTNIFWILIILNISKGVHCENGITALVAASTVTGILFLLVFAFAIIFAFWRDYYKKSQEQKGRQKVPRSWLREKRLAKKLKKEKFQQLRRSHLNQMQSGDSRYSKAADVEMQYMHKSRPELPGSWRQEVRNSNGFLVHEVPTFQKTIIVDGKPMQPVFVQVDKNDPAVYKPGGVPLNFTANNPSFGGPSTVVNTVDKKSVASSSTNSTLEISDKRRFRNVKYNKDEVIEASIDFSNDDVIDDNHQLQERVTAF